MPAICLCFHLHIPTFLKPYSFFDLGVSHDYFDHEKTVSYLDKISSECLLPANQFLKNLMLAHKGNFKIGLAISGSTLSLLEAHRPDVLASFLDLITHGNVELLAQNDGYTLSFMFDRDEYKRQIETHKTKIKRLFHAEAHVVMTTAGLYSNPMGYLIQKMGYQGIICGANQEGLKGRHVHQLFHPPHLPDVPLMFADDQMTNAVEIDFSINNLDAHGMGEWLSNAPGEIINLVWDYRVLGNLHKASSGIFNFMEKLPSSLLASGRNHFLTPSESFQTFTPKEVYDISRFTTRNADRYSYVSNSFQQEALRKLYYLKKMANEHGDNDMIHILEKMQDAYYVREMGYHGSDKKEVESAYSRFFNIFADIELCMKDLIK